MIGYLVGTTVNKYVSEPVKLLSILVCAGAAGADFHIHDGQDVTRPPLIHIHGAASWTEQYEFRGFACPNGFTAEPASGITDYIVEYEYIP